MALSDLVGNRFWDNSDPNGGKANIIRDTDKRREFVIEFKEWVKPYCTKNTKWQAKLLGLFGTAEGVELNLQSGNIKKSVNMSIDQLIKKFGDENNIPVFISHNRYGKIFIFSNKYSMSSSIANYDGSGSFSAKYSTEPNDAYEEVYGKPRFVKTDKVIGTLSEYLKKYSYDTYVSISNYNYVGYIAHYAYVCELALEKIRTDFDVIKCEDKRDSHNITIQTDDLESLKKFDHTVNDIWKYKLNRSLENVSLTEQLKLWDSKEFRDNSNCYELEMLYESNKTMLSSQQKNELSRFVRKARTAEEINTYMKGMFAQGTNESLSESYNYRKVEKTIIKAIANIGGEDWDKVDIDSYVYRFKGRLDRKTLIDKLAEELQGIGYDISVDRSGIQIQDENDSWVGTAIEIYKDTDNSQKGYSFFIIGIYDVY